MVRLLPLIFNLILVLPAIAVGQETIVVDFTIPSNYSDYPSSNPTYPQYVGDYIGPYSSSSTIRGPVTIDASGYHCYPTDTLPGGTRCLGPSGVFAQTVGVSSTYSVKKATLSLRELVNGEAYFGLEISCRAHSGNVDCTNTCSISGASPADGGGFIFSGASANVGIACSQDIAEISFTGGIHIYYVFATSIAVEVGPPLLCKVSDKGRTVPFRSQVDSQWARDPFGIPELSRAPGDMRRYGCAITAVDMIFESYGIKNTPLGSPAYPSTTIPFLPLPGLDGGPLNPGSLNKALANYRVNFIESGAGSIGFNSVNDPLWAGAAEVARAGYRAQCRNPANACNPENANDVVSFKWPSNGFGEQERQEVEGEICNGNPVMLKFRKPDGGQHFMLATGIELDEQGNKTFILHNPGSDDGRDQVYGADLKAKYPEILNYILFRPSSDPSMVFFTAPMKVHFVVTDPLGRKTGYNPHTATKYFEIPGATYSVQSIDTPNEIGFEPETLVRERYFTSTVDVPDGFYRVQIYAVESGKYYLDHRSYDITGTTNDASLVTGVLEAGASRLVNIEHTSERILTANAKFDLQKYSVHKSPPQGAERSTVKISGTITPLTGTGIKLESSFKLLIGGKRGFKLSIPASQFTSKAGPKKISFSYHQNGIKIELNDMGEVKIDMHNSDLSKVDPAHLGHLRIDVDGIRADLRTGLNCKGDVCTSSGK